MPALVTLPGDHAWDAVLGGPLADYLAQRIQECSFPLDAEDVLDERRTQGDEQVRLPRCRSATEKHDGRALGSPPERWQSSVV